MSPTLWIPDENLSFGLLLNFHFYLSIVFNGSRCTKTFALIVPSYTMGKYAHSNQGCPCIVNKDEIIIAAAGILAADNGKP